MGYAENGIDEEVAARIRAAVEEKGVSERSVFLAAGVADGTWHRCVRLGAGSLRVPQLIRIAAVLEVPASQFIAGLQSAPTAAVA